MGILGLFILSYICIRAYKEYGRKEYQTIPASKGGKSTNIKLKRISLRNIGIAKPQNDEKKTYHASSNNVYMIFIHRMFIYLLIIFIKRLSKQSYVCFFLFFFLLLTSRTPDIAFVVIRCLRRSIIHCFVPALSTSF